MFQRLLCRFNFHDDKIIHEGVGEGFVGKFQLHQCSKCDRKIVWSSTRSGKYSAESEPRVWFIASRSRLKPADLAVVQEWAK